MTDDQLQAVLESLIAKGVLVRTGESMYALPHWPAAVAITHDARG